MGRFPATAWLIGLHRLEKAARRFVHDCPPSAPCIAEYGLQFTAFLATWPETAHLPYVPEFADLDWHLGRLAVSIDVAAVGREHLAAIDPSEVGDLRVTLQSGTHYRRAAWAIDELIGMYLTDSSPESWTLRDEEAYIEARGARGAFRFTRLSAGAYAFRVSLADGHTLADAAERALALDLAFDPGTALMCLLDEQLIASIGPPQAEEQS